MITKTSTGTIVVSCGIHCEFWNADGEFEKTEG